MDYNSINKLLSFPNSIKTKCRLRSTVDLFLSRIVVNENKIFFNFKNNYSFFYMIR